MAFEEIKKGLQKLIDKHKDDNLPTSGIVKADYCYFVIFCGHLLRGQYFDSYGAAYRTLQKHRKMVTDACSK